MIIYLEILYRINQSRETNVEYTRCPKKYSSKEMFRIQITTGQTHVKHSEYNKSNKTRNETNYVGNISSWSLYRLHVDLSNNFFVNNFKISLLKHWIRAIQKWKTHFINWKQMLILFECLDEYIFTCKRLGITFTFTFTDIISSSSATSGAGTAYPSGAHEFTLVFFVGFVLLNLSFSV